MAADADEAPVASVPDWARCELCFMGQYTPERAALLRRLKPEGRVRTYSPRHERWTRKGFDAFPAVYGERLAAAVAGADVVLGESRRHDLEGYWSDRPYRVLGFRGFFLTQYAPGFERMFRNREHLVWFTDPEEASALFREYMAKPEARRAIADAGFRHVREHHTYDHRVRELLEILRSTRIGVD
jgi:spore maturation protein CgeB